MYTREERLGAVPVAALVPVASKILPNLFATSTEGLNSERIAQNIAYAERALAGDRAAWATLQQRAQPGVLPYKVATDDARMRVEQVKAAMGNRVQSSGGTTFVPGSGAPSPINLPGGGQIGSLSLGNPMLLASLGFVALAFILRDRR